MTCSLANPCRCTSGAVTPGMHADESDREPPRRDILSLTANYKLKYLQCVKKFHPLQGSQSLQIHQRDRKSEDCA